MSTRLAKIRSIEHINHWQELGKFCYFLDISSYLLNISSPSGTQINVNAASSHLSFFNSPPHWLLLQLF